MNIAEAYIKFKGQLIILVSGLSGSGKADLAREIERDFKLERLNLDRYYLPDFDEKVKLSNGTELVDWDNFDAVDWAKFNGDVQRLKKKGVVISGFAFPQNRLNFGDGAIQDFHFHLKMSKETITERRHAFLEKHRDDPQYKPLYDMKDTKVEKLALNEITYPRYLESLDQSLFDVIYNGDNKMVDDIYDDIFEHLVRDISEYLYEKAKFETGKKKKMDKFKSQPKKESTDEDTDDFSITPNTTKILL